MQKTFLGLSIEVWAGALLGSIVVPILWWLVQRFLDWLWSQCSIRLVLGGMSKNEDHCQVILSDFAVELHTGQFPNPNNIWPLLRKLPPRLGGTIYGRGINIPTVWADCDGQAIADVLNLLGQAGKKEKITITRFSEDVGKRDCHIIVIGGQDLIALDFYKEMNGVYYRMDDKEIYHVDTGGIVHRDPNYGYGLIIKATNPFSRSKEKGVGILVGGFGVLGTQAAAYYLRTHAKQLGAQFGKNNFSIVVRAPVSTGYQGAQRIAELDRPTLARWQRVMAFLRKLVFRA